jgi:hypothetical protein
MKPHLINEFAFHSGYLTGLSYTILNDDSYFEYFSQKKVDIESFEKLIQSLKEISKAYYEESKP